MACQSVISSTFKNISQAKTREPGVTPYISSNGGLHGMHCSGQWIMSLARVILRRGLVCTSVLSTLCIVLRLAYTSILSTLCIVWYCHAQMFLAHDVLFEISITNFEALSIQVNALNSTCQPLTLTYDSNKPEILKIMLLVVGVKLMVTSFASIWYQSLGWWWRWFNVSHNLFLTSMSHHLVESFDSMNYHWFKQCNFSNWVKQDLSYNRWCCQHCHLVVSWASCLNHLLVDQAVVHSAAAIH